MATENKNLHLIQVLRGVASLLVVFFHATMSASEILNQSFLSGFFIFGFSGLDIFFVLSGFIITHTSLPKTPAPAKLVPFVRRRFVRIFPTYWIIITVFLAMQVLFASFYTTHFVLTAPNLVSTYLLFPGHVMLNGVSWTLSNELFFYLIFTLVFLIPKRGAFIVFAAYALLIIALPFAGFYSEKYTGWLNLVTFPMNLEFFLGILAALLIPKIPARSAVPLIVSGIVLFLAGAWMLHGGLRFAHGDFNRVLIFGLPSFIIIIGVVKFELPRQLRVHSILLSLGEASYSLYLLHLPVIAAFSKIILRLNIKNNFLIQVLLLMLIVVICYLSILFYNLIEKPVIKRLNTVLNKKPITKTTA